MFHVNVIAIAFINDFQNILIAEYILVGILVTATPVKTLGLGWIKLVPACLHVPQLYHTT